MGERVKRLIAFANPDASHHAVAAAGIVAGARRHGVSAEVRRWPGVRPPAADAYAVWGWRKGAALARTGRPVLVMERGYVGDRMAWTSLGWNGLNGRADFRNEGKDGARFERHFAPLLAPAWKAQKRGLAVIMGQVEGDAALLGCDFPRFVREAAATLAGKGWAVRFRHHPQAVARRQYVTLPQGVRPIGGTMEETLALADLAVTWNSNSGVDAALAGVPTVAGDAGSMAWPVRLASVDALPPDEAVRRDWANRLAWCQWSAAELEGGDAWDHIGKGYLDGALQADRAG